MRQVIGWLSVVAIFGGSAAGWYLQRDDAQAAVPDAAAFAFADYNLGQATEKVEQMGAILGSYDGIPHDLVIGMTVAYASGGRYCIQLMREGNVYHRGGPGGSAQRGPCV